MIEVKGTPDNNFICGYFHGEGREWHTSEQNAKFKAQTMKTAKLAALHKQIAKLEKLSFA